MKNNNIKPFVLYLFHTNEIYYGVTRVILKDGFDEIYQYAWKIEDDPNAKRNGFTLNKSRAKTNVKKRLENVLNALNCYGKKVLDKRGDISWEKFQLEEAKTAKSLKNKTGIELDINTKKPLFKFKVNDIDLKKAKELKLI